MKEKQRAGTLGVIPKIVKLMFLLIPLCFSEIQAETSLNIQSPEKTVSGAVTDESGSPIAGVVVSAKGTRIVTSTDINGAFSLNIPAETGTLQFSFLGMKTKELPVGNESQFNVVMEYDAVGIDDVIVVGYGTRTKKDMSIAVGSIKGDDLNSRTSDFNILQGVAGKVAGVQNISMSGRPGGKSSLRVRGMGSINAGKDPVYVMDGVIGVDPDIINSANVESIEVLKDAAATAMYGAQGSNGVILITTKKGEKGKGLITYEGKAGFGLLNRTLDLLNADEYMEVQKRAYAYSGQTAPYLTTPMENLFYYAKDNSGAYQYDANGFLIASPKYNTDWQKELTQTAITNDHIISFSSANDNSSVYASLGYQNYQGLIKETLYKRLTGTVNVSRKINDWFRIQILASVGNQEGNNNDEEGSFYQRPVRNMAEMPPIVPVQYEDGTWGRKHDVPLGEEGENPLLVLRDKKNEWKSNFAVFSLNATLNLTKKLTFTAQGDYQMANRKEMSYAKAGLLDVSANNGGYADISNSDAQKFSSENYFTFTDNFFDGQLSSNFVLGASWYYNHSENSSSGSEQYFDDSFDYYNLAAGTTFHKPGSGMSQNTMNSYYFRMNHTFRDRYLLGFSFRADGASNFGANNKYGYFPSVSAGWRISEENFFQPVKDIINQMKIRASYGVVGNASIPNYMTISQYSNNSLIFNKDLNPYVTLSNLGNEDLKWESSHQFNVGLDLNFFNSRLEVILDYYRKSTKDLLFQKQVPYTTGYSTSWTNLGEIVNKGFEATITSRNIHTRDFMWITDLVFSTNKLVVVDINGETIDTGNNTIAKEGEEWAAYSVYRRLGTWSLAEVAEAAKYNKKPGDIKYEDVNGDYVIDENDRQIMGSGTPKGSLTMINTFNYKGFSLTIDLNYTYGFKIMGITNSMLENRPLFSNNMRTILDAWTPENQNTMIAALRLPSDERFGENEKDSFMLHKGDFFRIRNIALSYTFSPKILEKLKFINDLSIGVSVENLWVFTAYPGYDPEVGAFATDTGQGISFYSYPRPTTISANLKITF
ncbi:MAG: TonB-dependent receptor [Bacteroidales bacterium]|jgi:TonB-linked SusC/RagA family outer membrane protein|nr:TonB-dependent receptor [Bacteroidales bacterium]